MEINDKQAKRVRRWLKDDGVDWREKRYQYVTNSLARNPEARRVRLTPGTGRDIYQRIKRNVQAIWATRGW